MMTASTRGRVPAYPSSQPWRQPGQPTPQAVRTANARSDGETDTDLLVGVGVSAGVVEGIVRVVMSPDDEDIRPDEILVAPFTDPSWSSIMFISSALVVDIGGALSHAAVVARELGIPCVVSTGHGTQLINTGDQVRVDGTKGTVEILARRPAERGPHDVADWPNP